MSVIALVILVTFVAYLLYKINQAFNWLSRKRF